jgi:hypothetical protein
MRSLFLTLLPFTILPAAAAPTEVPEPNAVSVSASGEGVAFVRWNMTNEQNMREFRVLRGETAEGPWTQIAVVPAQGEGIHGRQTYLVEDRGLPVGQRYYYMIEHENVEGVAVRAGPVPYTVELEASPEAEATASPEE